MHQLMSLSFDLQGRAPTHWWQARRPLRHGLAVLFGAAVAASSLQAQAPSSPIGIPSDSAAPRGRALGGPPAGGPPPLPPMLAAVLLPPRTWRLDVAFEGLPWSGLRAGSASALGTDLDRRAGRLSARLAPPALVRGRGRTIVLQDLLYERAAFDYRPTGTGNGSAVLPAGLPGTLHTIQYAATLAQRLDARWRLALSTQAALVSDLRDVDLDHVRLTGQALATRQVRPNLQWGAGLGWINVGPRLVPLARVLWVDPKGTRRLDVLLPNRAEYWAALAPGVEVGGALRLSGNRFTIGDTTAAPYRTLVFTEGSVGPAIALQHGAARLQLEGGVAFVRTLRQEGALVNDRSLSPGPGAFVRATARVAWR